MPTPTLPFHITQVPFIEEVWFVVYLQANLENGHPFNRILFMCIEESHLNKWIAHFGTEAGIERWISDAIPMFYVTGGQGEWALAWDYLDQLS